MTRLRGALLSIAAVFLVACVNGNGPIAGMEETTAVQLYSSVHCGAAQDNAAMAQIMNAEELTKAYERMRGRFVGGAAMEPAPVNFDREVVLLIDMGQRRTAGYALTLAHETVKVTGQTAHLRVAWVEPPPEAMVAQVLTSPCVLVKFPRAGLSAVRVVDQDDRLRAQISLR